MGWPLRTGKRFREFGGSFVYPMGEDMVTIGLVVGLDYRDASLSVHDLLQELKTHPKIRKILAGGERLEWGAKTIPSGGFHSLPRRLHAPGLLLCGDGAGMVNIPRLKGVHYAIESGRLARRVPREVAELWAHMCPAQVYEVGAADRDGTVLVELAPSNCVQCGAITAKGGRLTPPEGGSGPGYTKT